MKIMAITVLLLLVTLPANAGIDPLPQPQDLRLGNSLAKTLETLKTKKAVVTSEEKKQPGIHGSPYTYTRVEATLPQGPVARAKLYFYNKTLARMQLLSRDHRAPLAVDSFGKPSLASPTGRQFWWDRKNMSGISCQGRQAKAFSSPTGRLDKGECELFDMRVLVDILGNRHQIEVQFQLLIQGTAEKVETLKKKAP